jgi:hypothetical protein
MDTTHGAGIFSRLPIEILQGVVRLLPLADATALGLANRSLHQAIGGTVWEEMILPERKEQKLAFLALLQKDMPRYWVCDVCGILHKGKDQVVNRGLDVTRVVHFTPKTQFPFGYALTENQVQMAVERATRGYPHGMCPEQLSCAGIIHATFPRVRIDYAYRVRVAHGELVVRLDFRVRHQKGIENFRWNTLNHHPCHHYRPLSNRRKRRDRLKVTWFLLAGSLLGTRHVKAAYPYVPHDVKSGNRPLDDDPAFPLHDTIENFSQPFRHGSECGACYCFSIRDTADHPHSRDTIKEHRMHSFQNLGTGKRDDERWYRTWAPARYIGSLLSHNDTDDASRVPFETGAVPLRGVGTIELGINRLCEALRRT